MRPVVMGLSLALVAGAAQAADKPVIAPPEAWVKLAEPEKAIPPADSAAVKILLLDQQLHFTNHGDADYTERRFHIQNAQGLAALGTIVLPWNPDTDVLTIHKLTITRGDQVIDVLAKQTFTVVRRETNLEAATLDGVLTAVIQPEGLQVGDTVDMAFTLTRSDPVMKGHSQTVISGEASLPIARMRMRALWDQPKPIRWRASDGLDGLKLTRAGATSALELDALSVQPLHPPEGAPARFNQGRQLEFSEFGSWAEVAALMRPLYVKAATLSPTSPLRAEAAKIKAASSDPKTQAEAALALVQDQVRYVFLGMNDGGLIPADADTTWTRRFGDCKAKTAMLLALLGQLGISAQPALVSTGLGDGLDQRLPSLAYFDHVMVRAVIGGHVYWMDGTRSGDISLDRLRIPPFKWALPIGGDRASLEALSPPPLDTPDLLTTLTLDASDGLDAPAPAHAELIFRGDAAVAIKQKLADLSPADLDRALRQHWSEAYDYIDVTSTSAAFDPKLGEEKMVMDGTAKVSWDLLSGTNARRHEADGAVLGWKADFKRHAADHADAPYAVSYPSYVETRETIRLPHGGAGFSVDTENVDQTLAGEAFKRVSTIDKGVFTMDASVRSLVPEFPASEAPAAAKALSDMSKITAYVRAPGDYVATAGDVTALLAVDPADSAGYLARSKSLLSAGNLTKALADADRAVALDPKSAPALLQRGWVQLKLGALDKAKSDLDQAITLDSNSADAYASRGWVLVAKADQVGARADFDKALTLDPRDTFVISGAASLAMAQGRNADAVALLSVALATAPNAQNLLQLRADAYWASGDTDHALADTAAVLALNPGRTDIRLQRAQIFQQVGQVDKGLAEIDAAIASAPDNSHLKVHRGYYLAVNGRKAEARQAFDAVIAKTPTVEAYLTRASYRDKTDYAGRLADADAAQKLDPQGVGPLLVRADVQLDTGDFDHAAETLSEALQKSPKNVDIELRRAMAYAKGRHTDLATKDFGEVRPLVAKNASGLNNLCWDQAIVGVGMDAALGDCDRALAMAPQSAALLDSRAFVLLRLGRLDEALTGFDAVLKLAPKQASSLFARGVTKLRKGMVAEGQADLAAARAIRPDVDAEYAGYGVKP